METLDQVGLIFENHRINLQKQGKTFFCYPETLWRHAISLNKEYSLEEIASTLKVSIASLSTYKIKFQASPAVTFTKMVIAPSATFTVTIDSRGQIQIQMTAEQLMRFAKEWWHAQS
jgi:hypothetical protein